MNTKQTIIDKYIKDFRKEFCNDHNERVRLLRGVFVDEEDAAEKLEQFLKSALQAVVVDTLNAVDSEMYDGTYQDGDDGEIKDHKFMGTEQWNKLKSRLSIEKKNEKT